jgi:hypothetical protein
MDKVEKPKTGGKQWFAIFIIAIGVLFLVNSLGFDLPSWVLSWPMYIIGIGLLVGITNRFKDWSWLIIVLFGAIFIVDDITGIQISVVSFLIPVTLILIGLRILFKKKEKTIHFFNEATGTVMDEGGSREDSIELIAVFAGNKKIIVSKNFKGGSLISVFGGNEINLINADFQGTIRLEIVQFFGGAKLVVPSNWLIQSEIASVFGGLDDKRGNISLSGTDTQKVLILEGVSVFAGIDIRSY